VPFVSIAEWVSDLCASNRSFDESNVEKQRAFPMQKMQFFVVVQAFGGQFFVVFFFFVLLASFLRRNFQACSIFRSPRKTSTTNHFN
jgi:hypothetical protein